MHIEQIESEPFAENSYLAWADGSPTAVVFDPGFDPDAILKRLQHHRLSLAAILLTHGHVDHIAGVGAMKQAFPDAPVLIGVGDAPMLTDSALNLSGKWGFNIVSPPADRLLTESEMVAFAGLTFEVREIPGHSPGHVVFVEHSAGVVFGGDVLFSGSVGRTDFPGGSFEQLKSGIHAKLFPLPDATRVLPGHGPSTTIGHEKRTNPYVRV